MPLSCPFCSDSELSWENGSYVCTSCGAVVERNCLVSDEGVRGSAGGGGAGDDFRPATARERQAFACRSQKHSISEGLSSGIKATRRIAQCLECKPGMTGEAVELFERIFKHPYFNARQSVAKRALAACSVYIICRQHGWPIMLSDICQFAGCTPPELLNCKNQVVKTFKDLASVHPPDLFELTDVRCKKSGLTEKVHQTTVELLALCRDLWISVGRKPDNIINAACYLAWQAEEPISRARVRMMDFCRLKQLTYSKDRMTKYVHDIRATLCKLAEQIPWVLPGSINDRTVILHLADILSFRSSLIVDARRSVLSTLEDEDHDDNDDESKVASTVTGDAAHEVTDNPSVKGSFDPSTGNRNSVENSSPQVVASETSHLESILNECVSGSSINNGSNHQDGTLLASSHNIVNIIVVPVKTEVSHENTEYAEPQACSAYGLLCHDKHTAAKKKRCRGTEMLEPNWPTWPKQSRNMASNDYPPEPVTHPDIDAPELSSHDIPDSQLHFYIKDLDN